MLSAVIHFVGERFFDSARGRFYVSAYKRTRIVISLSLTSALIWQSFVSLHLGVIIHQIHQLEDFSSQDEIVINTWTLLPSKMTYLGITQNCFVRKWDWLRQPLLFHNYYQNQEFFQKDRFMASMCSFKIASNKVCPSKIVSNNVLNYPACSFIWPTG